jgi:hypothetical protein
MSSGGSKLQRKVASAAGLCRMCELRGRKLTRHRVVPGREGGPYEARNVVPLCRACHDLVEDDRNYRSLLRELLWPEELSYAVSRMGRMWFDEVYPPSTLRADQARMALTRLRDMKTATTKPSAGLEPGAYFDLYMSRYGATGWHAFDRV